MSIAKKGKPSHRKGVKLSQQERDKISAGRSGIPVSKSTKEKLRLKALAQWARLKGNKE